VPDIKDDYSKLSFKSLILRFVKISSVYGFFRFISRFGAFFIIPIYWHFLSPKDYGILALTAVLQGVLYPVVNLGLHGSVSRFYYEWTQEERAKKIGTLWLSSILIALLFVFLIEATANYVFPILFKNVSYNPFFRIMLWTILFNSFRLFPFNILRVTEKVKTFGIISFLSFLVNAIIVIFLLVVMDFKVLGVLLGGLVNGGIWAIFWIIWMSKRMKLNLDISFIKEEFYYSLPSLPINIIDSIGKNFDRYLLEKYLGLTQLGYYSIGNRFGNYYNQVNSSLKTAWFPMAYKMLIQRKDMKKILPSLSLFYFYILTIFALSASLLLKEIIFWFGKEKFIEAYKYVPLFILVYLIMNFATAWGRGLDLAKKPQYALFSTICGAAVGITLFYIFIPKFGTYGALGALLISSFVRTFIFVLLAHIFYPRKFLLKKVLLICLPLAFVFLVGYHIEFDSTIASFLVKCLLIFAYVVLGAFITFGYRKVMTQLGQVKLQILGHKPAAD